MLQKVLAALFIIINIPPGNRVSLYLNFHTLFFDFIFWHQSFFLPYFVSAPRRVLLLRTGRVTGCDLRNHIITLLCHCRPRLSHIAGTPPQSTGGREEVSLFHDASRARIRGPAGRIICLRQISSSLYPWRSSRACFAWQVHALRGSLRLSPSSRRRIFAPSMGQRTCNPECFVFKVRISGIHLLEVRYQFWSSKHSADSLRIVGSFGKISRMQFTAHRKRCGIHRITSILYRKTGTYVGGFSAISGLLWRIFLHSANFLLFLFAVRNVCLFWMIGFSFRMRHHPPLSSG